MLRPLFLFRPPAARPRRRCLTAAGPDAHAATSVARPPNIIFILADDLGYGDLGCYGSAAIATPYIDQLAREGTRFTNVYSGSPVCAPSRAVLMSGLHTGHTRIRNNSPRVGGTPEAFAGGAEGGVRLSLTASRSNRRRGAARGRLCHRHLRRVGTGRTRHRRHADAPRLRSVARLPESEPCRLLLHGLPRRK